jgi:hypothetical protein
MALVVGHVNTRRLSKGGTACFSLLQKMIVGKPHRLKSYGFSFGAKVCVEGMLIFNARRQLGGRARQDKWQPGADVTQRLWKW